MAVRLSVVNKETFHKLLVTELICLSLHTVTVYFETVQYSCTVSAYIAG